MTSVPHIFVSGTTILADEVNENFQFVEDQIDLINQSIPDVYLGQVATQCSVLHAKSAGNFQLMSVSEHHAREDIEYIEVGNANWYVDSVTHLETNAGADADIIQAVEYPLGTRQQLLFSGVKNGVIADGTTKFADRFYINIPQGEKYWIRTYRTCTAGILYQSIGEAQTDAFQFAPTGVTDKTLVGTVVSTSPGSGLCHRPIIIAGNATKPSFFFADDSKDVGATDPVNDKSGDTGELARSIGPVYAYSKMSRAGDLASIAVTSYAKRLALKGYFTHAISGLGINDLLNSRTAAQVIADRNTLNAMLAPLKVYGVTLAPCTTSTDSFTTLANQTFRLPVEADRQSVNTSIRAGLTTEIDVLDTAFIVESPTVAGKWKVYPEYVSPGLAITADGTHENNLGNNLIKLSRVININMFRR